MDIFAKLIGTDSKNIYNDETYYTDIFTKIMDTDKSTENTNADYYMDIFSKIMGYDISTKNKDQKVDQTQKQSVNQTQKQSVDQSNKYDPNELIDRVLNLMQSSTAKNTKSNNTNTNNTQITKDGVEISDFDEMEGYDYIPSYSEEFIEKINQSEKQPILSEENYCCDNHNSNKTMYSETISDNSEQDNSEQDNSENNIVTSDISGESYSSNVSDDDDMPSLLDESDNDSIDKNEDAWKSSTWNEYINANVSVE